MKCLMTAVTSMALSSSTTSGQIASATAPTLAKSLRAYRTGQAYIRAIPANSVFGDKIMQDIVSKKPASAKSLMSLHGMGVKRLKCYGADILRLVSLHSKKNAAAAKVKAMAKAKPASAAAAKSARPRAKKVIKAPPPRPRPRPRPRPKPKPKPGPCYASLKPLCDIPVAVKAPPPSTGTSVYILELENGRVYVGTSKDVARRVREHTAGTGSAFTKAFKPTGVRLPRLGNVSGDGDAAERDETLRYMMLKGIPAVRGWRYSRVDMPQTEFDDAETNIRELYDLCRKCGFPGHFVSNCRMSMDRWGKPCKCVK